MNEAILSDWRAFSLASWIAEIHSCSYVSVKIRAQQFVISPQEVRNNLRQCSILVERMLARKINRGAGKLGLAFSLAWMLAAFRVLVSQPGGWNKPKQRRFSNVSPSGCGT